MKELLKITKEKIKNHLHYGKWYYAAAIAAAVIIVNVAYTVTEPKCPNANRISIMIYANTVSEDTNTEWETDMLKILPDDQRQVEMLSTIPVDMSTQTVVIARIAAGEDDILIMAAKELQALGEGGGLIALDEYTDMDRIQAMYPNVNWSDYYFEAETPDEGKKHIYWLPIYMTEGLGELLYDRAGLGIAVLKNSGNIENAVICLEYMITK